MALKSQSNSARVAGGACRGGRGEAWPGHRPSRVMSSTGHRWATLPLSQHGGYRCGDMMLQAHQTCGGVATLSHWRKWQQTDSADPSVWTRENEEGVGWGWGCVWRWGGQMDHPTPCCKPWPTGFKVHKKSQSCGGNHYNRKMIPPKPDCVIDKSDQNSISPKEVNYNTDITDTISSLKCTWHISMDTIEKNSQGLLQFIYQNIMSNCMQKAQK